MVKSNYIPAVGRRKQAVARIRLIKNKAPLVINGWPAGQYFPGVISQKLLLEPLVLTGLTDKYTATVKVVGSGRSSQLKAVIHGLARAIVKLDARFKPTLKAAGLLTRDSRKKQRRMVGTGGKARRRKQSPKR
jgi:small subunit ribosomal protein S9